MCRTLIRVALTVLPVVALGLSRQATTWAALTPVFEYMAPGSGTGPAITDLSPTGNDGIVFPGTLLATSAEIPPGATAGTQSYDVTANGINTDAIDLIIPSTVADHGGFTYDVWFNWDGADTGNPNGVLISQAGTEQILLDDTNGEIEFQVNNAAVLFSPVAAQPNTWHHVIARFDTTGNPLLPDGTVDGTMTLTVDDLTVFQDTNMNDFGDSLDRPIGVGIHPLAFGTTDFQGLLYDAKVSLGVETLPEPLLEVDRDTRAVTLVVPPIAAPVPLLGYSITSAGGTLDPGTWTTIAGNYDALGDGSVDGDDAWTVLTSPANRADLSEAELVGGDGGIVASGESIALGTPWIQSPTEDVQAELLLTDGTRRQVQVQFVGNDGNRFAVGDLNFDGNIDTDDWSILRTNMYTDLSGLVPGGETYQQGDLNGDGRSDKYDFLVFETAFDSANGVGALAGLLAAVPEPSTWLLLLVGAGLLVTSRRRRPSQRVVTAHLLVGLLALSLGGYAVSAHAGLVSHYTFEDAANLGADTTGTNNGTPMGDASQGPGKVGNGSLRLDGDDDYVNVGGTDSFNNVADDGDGWTVAAWVNLAADAAPATGDNTMRIFSTYYDDGVAWTGTGWGLGNDRRNGDLLMSTTYGIIDMWLDPSPPIPDSEWTHWAYVYRNNGGAIATDYYINGVLAGSSTPTNQFGINKTDQDYAIGSLGLDTYPQDFNGMIDDLQIYDNELTAEEIQALVLPGLETLTLEVNTTSGAVTLRNDSSAKNFDINLYEITSASGSLNLAGWNSLEDQDLPGLPAGDGTGNGWEQVGGANSTAVSETFLEGSSVIGPSDSISLGGLFKTAGGVEDLQLAFHVEGEGGFTPGRIDYVSGGVLLGDVNLDGVVNGLDVDPFVDVLLNGPFQAQADMNADGVVNGLDVDPFVAAVVGGGVQAVPEPSTLVLLSLAAAVCLLWRRK